MQVQTVSTGISARLSVCQAILASSYSPVLRLLLFKPSDPKINSDTSERCEVALCTPLPCSLSLNHYLSLTCFLCLYLSLSVFIRPSLQQNIAATPTYSLSVRLFLSLPPPPQTHTPTHGIIHRPQMSLAHTPTWFHKHTNPYGTLQVRSHSATYEQTPWSTYINRPPGSQMQHLVKPWCFFHPWRGQVTTQQSQLKL